MSTTAMTMNSTTSVSLENETSMPKTSTTPSHTHTAFTCAISSAAT